MFGLNLLRAAIARLAGSLNSLADTADEIRASVRQQLALDAPPVEIAALPPGTPRIAQDEGSPEDAPTAVATADLPARNGRRKTATA
jgi:hypothetical protein